MGKVLFLIDTLSIGGAEKSLLEITSRLREVEPIVCTSYGREHLLESRFREAGLPVRHLGLEGKYAFREGFRRLAELLEEERPDLVVAALFRSEILARRTCPALGIPLVGSLVNDSYSKERYKRLSFAARQKLKMVELLDLSTARRAQAYYAITDTIARSNQKKLWLGGTPIRTIYRGRDPQAYSTQGREDRSPFIFLSTARLIWRKGYREMIKAMARLSNDVKAELWIAGDGPDGEQIRAYGANSPARGRIKFLGWQDDIPGLLARSHAFLLPSHYEGLGGGVIEAMLSNRPVILSDIPVFHEVAAGREHAWFVGLGDTHDLAAKMDFVIHRYEEARTKAEKALAFARERYDIEKIARQHEEFYLEVIEDFSAENG